MSTEDDNKAGLVPSQRAALSRSGATSLIRRGTQDLMAKAEAGQWCNLGHDYNCGRGVPQDDKQAAFWFRKAAEGGDADGQFMLAAMYLEGEGVPHDPEQAILWFRKSADQDDVGAQIVLGSIYEAGEIVPQDYAQAATWASRMALRAFDLCSRAVRRGRASRTRRTSWNTDRSALPQALTIVKSA